MAQPKTVTARGVNYDGSCFRGVVPMEIVKRYGIEDGDNLIWDDDGEGEITVRPPRKD